MSKIKKGTAVLLAALTAVCMLPFCTAAQETSVVRDNGITSVRDFADGVLRTELYVTGEQIVTDIAEPVDVLFVMDVSGSTYTETVPADTATGTIKKLNLMKDTVNSMIEKLSQQAPGSRAALVKFASEQVKNTIGDDTYRPDPKNIEKYNYTQIVSDFVTLDYTDPDNDGTGILTGAVSKLKAGGATATEKGLALAANLLQSDTSTHRKYVILLTDGAPSHLSTYQNSVANAAVEQAYIIKQTYGAEIYTIGLYSSEIAYVDAFMRITSSEYPNASSLSLPGLRSSKTYYLKAENASVFTENLNTVEETVAVPASDLGTNGVITEEISPYFDIDTENIRVHTETCTAVSGNTYTWRDDGNEGSTGITVEVTGNTVRISGFNYCANWAGMYNGAAKGKKVVAEIPVKDNGTGYGDDIPVNTENSGIYRKNTDGVPMALRTFAPYTVDMPGFGVAHEDGTVTVVRDSRLASSTVEADVTEYVSLQKQVTSGDTVYNIYYLYGGIYADESRTAVLTAADLDGHSGRNLPVGNGDTVYIREVSDEYLRPRTVSVQNGTKITTYLLSALDGGMYGSCGYHIFAEDGTPTENIEAGTPFSSLTVRIGTKKYVYTVSDGEKNPGETQRVAMFAGRITDENASVFCAKLCTVDVQDTSSTVRFSPYFITADGVDVSGIVTRTLVYQTGVALLADGSRQNPVNSDAFAVSGETADGKTVKGKTQGTDSLLPTVTVSAEDNALSLQAAEGSVYYAPETDRTIRTFSLAEAGLPAVLVIGLEDAADSGYLTVTDAYGVQSDVKANRLSDGFSAVFSRLLFGTDGSILWTIVRQ